MENIKKLQNQLIGTLIGLARATSGNGDLVTFSTIDTTIKALVLCDSDDSQVLSKLINKVEEEKKKLVPDCYYCMNPCGRTSNYDMNELETLSEEIQTIKFEILSGIKKIASSIKQNSSLAYEDENILNIFYRALFAIGENTWSKEWLQSVIQDLENINLQALI